MTAVAKRAVAFLATALVLISFVALPLSASSGVTGIVQSDGQFYYYVDGVLQKSLGLFYYDGFYYYCKNDGSLVADHSYFCVAFHSSAAEFQSLYGQGFYNFDANARLIFPTFGANSGSDYRVSYDITMNSDNIEHMAYVVDKQDWIPYMFPFKDRWIDTKYAGYYTYVPCIASLPISYDFPGYSIYAASSSAIDDSCLDLQRVFSCSLSLDSFDETKSRCTLTYTTHYIGSDPYESSLVLSEGVDFESSCVFIGTYFGYYYDPVTSWYSPIYAAFLIDNEFTFFPLSNTIDQNWINSYGYQYVFANSSEDPIHAYTLGFATTYAGGSTNGSVAFTKEEYQYGWNLLYGLVYPSNNMRAWINELYASALSPPVSSLGPTLDVVIDVLSGEIDSMKDVIHGDLEDIKDCINNPVSTIKPPPVKLPSSDQNSDLNDLKNAEGTINGYVDSVFGDIDSLVNEFLVAPPSDLTDYLLLSSAFTSFGNYLLMIPGFDLIVTGLTFVFLVWIMGLNLSSIRHSAERRQSREETRQYRSEQRAYWRFQFNRWHKR